MSLEKEILKVKTLELVDEVERILTLTCGLFTIVPVVCSVLVAVFGTPTVAEIALLLALIGSVSVSLLVRKILIKPFTLVYSIRDIDKIRDIHVNQDVSPIHYVLREGYIPYMCSLLNTLLNKSSSIVDHYVSKILSVDMSTSGKYALANIESMRIIYLSYVRRLIRKWKIIVTTSLLSMAILIPPLLISLCSIKFNVDVMLVLLTSTIPLSLIYFSVSKALQKISKEAL